MAREITIQEVSKHKTESSLWVIIDNDVYDLTTYLNEHPGGEAPLLREAGRDGTQAFDDVGHSEDAKELMKKFKIGTIPLSQQNGDVATCSNLKWYLLALAGALVIGFAIKKYTSR